MLGKEPTLIIQGIVAALNVAQLAVVSGPNWVNAAIAAVSIGLGAFLNRMQVSPVSARGLPIK